MLASQRERGKAELQQLRAACCGGCQLRSVEKESEISGMFSAVRVRGLSRRKIDAERHFALLRCARAWEPWRLRVGECAKIGHSLLLLASIWVCCHEVIANDVDAFDQVQCLLVQECLCHREPSPGEGAVSAKGSSQQPVVVASGPRSAVSRVAFGAKFGVKKVRTFFRLKRRIAIRIVFLANFFLV